MNDTWLSFLFRGGILMVPIVLCSIIGLALILDRFNAYYRLKLGGFAVAGGVRQALGRGDIAAAIGHLEGDESAGGLVLTEALARYHEGTGSIQSSFTLAAGELIRKMEVSLRGLATVAALTPLLGLLGTVVGTLIIGVLNSGLIILRVPPFWQKVIKGCVILLAVAIDKLNTKEQ